MGIFDQPKKQSARKSHPRHRTNFADSRHAAKTTIRKRLAQVLVPILGGATLTILTLAPAQAVSTTLVPESFNGPDNGVTEAVARGWEVGGTGSFYACAGAAEAAGEDAIFADNNHTEMVDSTGGSTVDRLRLTFNKELCATGYAQYNIPQTAVAGLDINFNISMNGAGGGNCPDVPADNYNEVSGGNNISADHPHANCQADGVVFYLKDGANTSSGGDALGAAGGSLGYAPQIGNWSNINGLDGGLLGIGFDAYGNFYQRPFGGSDCYGDPIYADGLFSRRSLTVRGPEGLDESGQRSRTLGYCRISTNNDRVLDNRNIGVALPNDLFSLAGQAVRIVIDPEDLSLGDNGTISIYSGPAGTSDWSGIEPITSMEIPLELRDAETFKFGFVAGTGGGTMNADIWSPRVNSVRPIPAVTWKTPPTTYCGIDKQYFYAQLSGQFGAQPYHYAVTDGALPDGLTLNENTGVIEGVVNSSNSDNPFSVSVTDSSTPTATSATQLFGLTVASTCPDLLHISDHNLYENLVNGKLDTFGHETFTVQGYDPTWSQGWYRCSEITDPTQLDPTCSFTGATGIDFRPTGEDVDKYLAFAVSATDLSPHAPITLHANRANKTYQVTFTDTTTETSTVRDVTSNADGDLVFSLTGRQLKTGHSFSVSASYQELIPVDSVENLAPNAITYSQVLVAPTELPDYVFRIHEPLSNQNWDSNPVVSSVTGGNDYQFHLVDLTNPTVMNLIYGGNAPVLVNEVAYDFSLLKYDSDTVSGTTEDTLLAHASTVRYTDYKITNQMLAPSILNLDGVTQTGANPGTWDHDAYDVTNNPDTIIEQWLVCNSVPSAATPESAVSAGCDLKVQGPTVNPYQASDLDAGKFVLFAATAINQFGSWTEFRASSAIVASPPLPNPITWAQIADMPLDTEPFYLEAWNETIRTLIYGSNTPSVCIFDEDLWQVKLLSVGRCELTAESSGGRNAGRNWAPSPQVTNSFMVTEPTASPSPTSSASPSTSASPSASASRTPSSTPSQSSSSEPSATPTESASVNPPVVQPSATPYSSGSTSSSPSPSRSESAAASKSPSNPPTTSGGGTARPTHTGSVDPGPKPSVQPSARVTSPSSEPTSVIALPKNQTQLNISNLVGKVLSPKADPAIGATGNDHASPVAFSPLQSLEGAKRMLSIAAWFVVLMVSSLIGSLGRPRKSLRMGALAEVSGHIENHKQQLRGWGDRRAIYQFKVITWLDSLSADAIRVTYPKFPVLAKIFNEGAYLRAFFGSLTVLGTVAAGALGIYGSFMRDHSSVVPATWLLLAIVVTGIFDAFSGLIATFAFTVTTLLTIHTATLQDYRTLLGVLVLGFAPALTAEAFRTVRRKVEKTGIYRWERLSDFAIAPFITGVSTVAMVSCLPALANLTLPVANHVMEFGVIVAAAMLLRIGLEEIAARLYPQRSDILNPSDLQQPTRLRSFFSIVMKAAVYVFISTSIFGLSWQVYVACVLFLIPSFIHLFEDKLPNSRFMWRYLPKGIPNMALGLTVALTSVGLIAWLVRNPETMAKYGFMLLAVPALVITVLHAFGRHGQQGELKPILHPDRKWIYRLGGIVMFILTVGLTSMA